MRSARGVSHRVLTRYSEGQADLDSDPCSSGQPGTYRTKVERCHHLAARKHQAVNGGAGKTVKQSSTTRLSSAWSSTLNRPQVAIGS